MPITTIDTDSISNIISQELSSLWEILDGEQRRVLIDNFTLITYKKNQVIYREGDTPKYIHCLLQGTVKKYKDGVVGRSQIIRLIRPIQYFGYRAYFADEHYVSSAAAVESSTIGLIPMDIIDSLIRQNNQLALFFIHELSHNLGRSDTKIVNLTQKHIRGRLAETLIALKDNYGLEDDESTLRVYLSREDLANMSNMTTANAIRTLAAFVDEKIIIVDGRKIKIVEEEQLRQISHYG
ncbi:MAG: Crp/Fnr family transcriptional regulator [Muribaculaceae bacterium]|nr:Crp/Fnr family transcriptional regulator [Muribaculaceae bacterium]MBO7382728.1 Crp/Fnr family transcriptional regulator [Muribaculaceae bacterium]MBP5314837.1 Crp/Fnr family transcriptional regulator [Muribaculaceae bacterium]MBR4722952.1 Crp/Fnr family transcriptional regulator [Muribaculaceae bacterium]MBR5436694.1 Crp/Fnr family transcriptional regulator [Muribaculaceae bacterium]